MHNTARRTVPNPARPVDLRQDVAAKRARLRRGIEAVYLDKLPVVPPTLVAKLTAELSPGYVVDRLGKTMFFTMFFTDSDSMQITS